MNRPLLMGILNVTPDSFSDGGLYLDADAAIEAGALMIDEGADLIDVGGESTRPGSKPVSLEEELRRVIPVVEGLTAKGLRVSIDTAKAGVANEAIRAGASMVNDVTALGDPHMAGLCAERGVEVCLMHMQGKPRTMQANPNYKDVVQEVRDYLLARAKMAQAAGISRERIWIDPGIGFGKTSSHNLCLLRHLDRLVETGYPVMVGVSRKSFLGRILGSDHEPAPVEDRLEATLAFQVLAQWFGAGMIRTHDIRVARRSIVAVQALMSSDSR